MVCTFLRTDSLTQKNCITGSRKENYVTVIVFIVRGRKKKMAKTQVKGKGIRGRHGMKSELDE